MKTKSLLFISFVIITSTIFTYASESKNNKQSDIELYKECKSVAQLQRQKNMAPALKEYIASSTAITKKAKFDYDKAVWFIRSSYLSESKKITERKNQEMVPVNEKVNKARASAENTLKAELALCDYKYNKGNKALPKK